MDGFRLGVARSLDLEVSRITEFSLTLTNNLGNKTFVKITVNYLNDNAPVFDQSSYQFSISSQTPIESTFGTYVGRVRAKDNDFLPKNRQVRYVLFGLPGPLGFRVGSTGELYIQNSPIELAGQMFNITIAATDDKHSVSVPVIVTVLGMTSPITTPMTTTTSTTSGSSFTS